MPDSQIKRKRGLVVPKISEIPKLWQSHVSLTRKHMISQIRGMITNKDHKVPPVVLKRRGWCEFGFYAFHFHYLIMIREQSNNGQSYHNIAQEKNPTAKKCLSAYSQTS